MLAVIAKNIYKHYAGAQALKGVDLELDWGELHGIIGPDGAGKTTLFRILTTLILSDRGTASIAGLDVVNDYSRIREIIGYMPGRFSLYLDLTVIENLTFFATLFNSSVQENYHLIEDIYSQIEPFKDRRAGALSGGMRQKLALCCALIHKPSVLFLDEPTTGVDPVSRKEFWNMLTRLKEQGITILVSTPYMDEAGLCDRISLMKEGAFMVTNTPANIISRFEGSLWAVRSDNRFTLPGHLRGFTGVESCFAFADTYHVTSSNNRLDVEELEKYLINKGHVNVTIYPIKPGIEDCFMRLAANV